MSKKKLLITLGCSYTEGVGCYIPELLKDNKPILSAKEVYDASLPRFHTLGWPAQLQKKIQYDCLYNLGRGGASNSQTVKQWFEMFSNTNFSCEFDVLVVWLVTYAGRISFYKNGVVRSLLPHFKYGTTSEQDLYDSYVKFLGDDYNKDIILETYFYVNIIKHICQGNNYKFLYLNVNEQEGKALDALTLSENSLNWSFKECYPAQGSILDEVVCVNPTEFMAFCNHPNERGYEIIADRMFTAISNTHKNVVNNDYTPAEYQMKYLGDPRQW